MFSGIATGPFARIVVVVVTKRGVMFVRGESVLVFGMVVIAVGVHVQVRRQTRQLEERRDEAQGDRPVHDRKCMKRLE